MELTMLLLMNGPKVNHSLAENCVELQEGWLELYEVDTDYTEEAWKRMDPENNWSGYKCYGVYNE